MAHNARPTDFLTIFCVNLYFLFPSIRVFVGITFTTKDRDERAKCAICVFGPQKKKKLIFLHINDILFNEGHEHGIGHLVIYLLVSFVVIKKRNISLFHFVCLHFMSAAQSNADEMKDE